ncbi:MAG: hypothetical protein EBE86_030030 [Hormoscilla sp. GUM202]|nr:hypothetical protein [Hormoscilla sp. GUM202]
MIEGARLQLAFGQAVGFRYLLGALPARSHGGAWERGRRYRGKSDVTEIG